MRRVRQVSALGFAIIILALASRAAATTPPPGFVLQESIAVPVDGSSVVSATPLLSGVTYKIRASGRFTIGPAPFGDAEYFFDTLNNLLGDTCPGVDIGLGINDPVIDSNKLPLWGAFNPANEYTIDFIGLGAPIGLNYHDCVYTDNSGSLTVEVFAPVTAVPTLSEWAQLGMAALLVGGGLVAIRKRSTT